MKKLVFLVIVMALVMSLAVGASAASITKATGVPEGEASITVELPDLNGAATANNTYKIYKVFNATTDGTNISYTLVDGKTTVPSGFTLSNQGNITYPGTGTDGTLTSGDIAAIQAYITDSDLVATVTTTKEDSSFTVEKLPYGYYYITTTTGTVVTVTSNHKDANVKDKNVVPTVSKKITSASSVDTDGKNALAQIGTDITYTGNITVGYGVESYVYHDTMGSGLSLKSDSITVKVNNATVDSANYSVNTTNLTNNETFTVSFTDTYIASLQKDTVISIEYKATITDAAPSTNAKENSAYLSYGSDTEADKTLTVTTKVYNAKITVTKQDGNKAALAGAGFVLKNASNAYYKYTTASADNADASVTWYTLGTDETLTDAIADGKVTEYTSDTNGAVAPFIGLVNGTYTLIENTVPAGYNKAEDVTITVTENDYTATNLEQAKTVINQSGSVLPSTGGVGTTIFYALGGLMFVGALVLLVTNKRMKAE